MVLADQLEAGLVLEDDLTSTSGWLRPSVGSRGATSPVRMPLRPRSVPTSPVGGQNQVIGSPCCRKAWMV
jgi:hypothetical protein